jgi:hypothetical protein
MATFRISESRWVSAAPPAVHAVLADYHQGHKAILPQDFFGGLWVEEGGFGEGTRIRYTVRMLGRELVARARISEPEPGRTLVETDLDTGTVTTFRMIPEPPGTRVVIESVFRWPGLQGWLAARLLPRLFRKVYRAELANLARITGSLSG